MCDDDGTCSTIYLVWIYISGGQDRISHAEMCADTGMWDVVVIDALNYDPPESCEYYANFSDFNNDSYMNFREMVPLGYISSTNSWLTTRKELQINCSDCSGMDVYNI